MNSWVKTVNGKGGAAAVAVLSVACLAVAVYLQESKGWFPCALCIVQRYAYLGTGLMALLALLVANRNRSLSRGALSFGLLVALAGMGVAAYHVWVLAHPGVTCGVDPLQVRLNALPWTPWWPMMFEADGLCTADYPPLLGLHLPAWSGAGLLVQAVWMAQTLRRLNRP